MLLFCSLRRPATSPLFPYTTLFRSAALVAGNTVIAKPAEQTPLIAAQAVQILWEAGIPQDVLQLLPGRGETIGAQLSQRSEEHTSELQSRPHLVCRLLLEKKKNTIKSSTPSPRRKASTTTTTPPGGPSPPCTARSTRCRDYLSDCSTSARSPHTTLFSTLN